MATAGSFILRWIHLDSHCFSCGQTRPQTAGRALVFFSTRAASRNSPRSIFLMNPGILIPTGHPCIHDGLAQSRQRLASVSACSSFKPKLTSSLRLCERYPASNSFILTRGIAVRSFGFIALRNSTRHGALRSSSATAASAWQAAGSSWSSL